MRFPSRRHAFAAAALLASVALAAPPDEKSPALRVLFIGNSYTYSNNLPEMVALLSGGRIETRMVARGGATLRQLWDLGDAPSAIREGRWDFVVLQEHSLLGGMRVDGAEHINEPDFFHENVRLYDAEIRKAKAKTLLYLTWARRASPDQQAYLNYAYTSIAQELNLAVAPVGVAWQKARETDPAVILYAADGTHPSATGSYLAACVFVHAIMGKKAPTSLAAKVTGHPIGANERQDATRQMDLVNLHSERAAQLQKIAEDATVPALATRPAYPTHGPLPPARRPVSPADLAGTWRGTLRFYAYPVNAELKLEFADGSQCTGHWSTWTPSDDRRHRAPIASCRITDVGVAFVMPDVRGVGPGETYWSHFTGDGLSGWADYRGLGKSSRLMGSFELRKQK